MESGTPLSFDGVLGGAPQAHADPIKSATNVPQPASERLIWTVRLIVGRIANPSPDYGRIRNPSYNNCSTYLCSSYVADYLT
jgi:hypothetical protein